MNLIMKQMPVVVSALNVGFLQTLKLFIVTLVGALPLGLVIAFGSMSHFKPLSWLARLIVWVIRGTPLMIQLLIIYYFPGLVLHNPIWGGGETGRFLAAAVSFIINYACYFSEIYRGGIQGVPEGQKEAAKSIGMTGLQAFFRVIFPQAVTVALPMFANQFLSTMKSTSIVFVITVVELFGAAKLFSEDSMRYFEAYMAVAILYWLMGVGFEFIFGKMEVRSNRFRKGNLA